MPTIVCRCVRTGFSDMLQSLLVGALGATVRERTSLAAGSQVATRPDIVLIVGDDVMRVRRACSRTHL